MAATFGAPLAAVVLAIELLLFEFSTRAFIPLVVASSVAGGMHAALFGPGPLFQVPPHDYAGLAVLPAVRRARGGCRAARPCSSAGVCSRSRAGTGGCRSSEFWHPVIGAVIFATIGLVRAAGARRGLRRHRRRAREQARGRHGRGARAGEAARVVGRARLGHVGRHARADPADQRGLRLPVRRRGRARCCPASTSRPARSPSSPWRRRSARRHAPRSPRWCSCSS